jgi:hypothetical protein
VAGQEEAALNSLLARVAGFVTDVASDRPTVAVRAAVVADNVDGLIFRTGVEPLLSSAGFDGIDLPMGDDALASVALADTLRPGDDRVRFGWLYLCGTLTIGRESMPVLQPLVSRLVQLRIENDGSIRARATSDLELIPMLADSAVEAGLLSRAPSLNDPAAVATWAREVVQAMGVGDPVPVEPVNPFDRVGRPGLTIVPYFGFHAGDRELPAISDDERTLWDGAGGALATTSFSELMQPTAAPSPIVSNEPVETLGLQLDREQVAVVHRARVERIVPVTGAPGTGKTRTIVSVALDAIRSGKSVLIATRSHHARDVVEQFLHAAPGPEPVTFGSEFDRARSIRRLQARQFGAQGEAGRDADDLSRYASRLGQLEKLHSRRRSAAHTAWNTLWGTDAVGGRTDLAEHNDRLARANAVRRELAGRSRLRRGRLVRELIRLVEPEDGELDTALRMLDEAATDPEDLTSEQTFPELLEAIVANEAEMRRLAGDSTTLRIRMLATAADLHAIRQLVRELSVGSRQRLFRRGTVSAASVTSVEPLWLGTLDEIDRMLPASPAMFDLAILDEAAQASLGEALPALARAASAVVVGDPQQMRYDSPRTDQDVDVAAKMFDVPPDLADRLAPNRATVFDTAAQAHPVSVLRRHYRSVPHIIEFPAEEFYAGQVDVMTRRPATESADALLEIEVDGTWASGTNEAEIQAILRQLHAEFGRNRTVGVVTPFPQQAAALVARIEVEVGADRVNELGLRVGTVDDFQGAERDLMIVSTVVSDEAPAAAFEFVNDPHVFNVMITRARLANYVVTSVRPDDETLLGRWLGHAATPPAPHAGSPSTDPWVASLAEDFRSAGVAVRTNYRVGAHAIDLVVGQGASAVGIDAGPAAQVDAPVDRRLELRALGWRIVDLPAARWADRRAEAVTEILGQIAG